MMEYPLFLRHFWSTLSLSADPHSYSRNRLRRSDPNNSLAPAKFGSLDWFSRPDPIQVDYRRRTIPRGAYTNAGL
jgi:hypothetical protein